MTALPSAGGSSHCAADPAALRPFPPAADETPAQPHAAAEGRGGAGPPRVPLSLPARRRGRGGAPPLEGGEGGDAGLHFPACTFGAGQGAWQGA